MAIVIPAPKGSTGWGKDIMSFLLSLHTVKKQTEIEKQRQLIRERETKVLEQRIPLERKRVETGRRQVGAYERQVGIAERRLPFQESEAEARRKLAISRAAGLDAQAGMDRLKLRLIQGLQKKAGTKEEYYLGTGAAGDRGMLDYLFPRGKTRELQSQLDSVNLMNRSLQNMLQMHKVMSLGQQQRTKGIMDVMSASSREVSSILGAPADTTVTGQAAQDMQSYYQSILSGDTEYKGPSRQEIWQNVGDSIQKQKADLKKQKLDEDILSNIADVIAKSKDLPATDIARMTQMALQGKSIEAIENIVNPFIPAVKEFTPEQVGDYHPKTLQRLNAIRARQVAGVRVRQSELGDLRRTVYNQKGWRGNKAVMMDERTALDAYNENRITHAEMNKVWPDLLAEKRRAGAPSPGGDALLKALEGAD